MAQSNIYAMKDNGDLRLVAEIEGEDNPALAVDALLDEMPRLKQREFIVINLDNVMVVEAEDEIINPRRNITISGYNGAAVAAPEDEAEDEDEEGDEEEEQEEEDEEEEPEAEAPKPRRGRARKPAPKPASSSKRGGSKKASPFKSNPKSAE